MLHRETRLHSPRNFERGITALIVALALLAAPSTMLAQRGGGGGGGGGAALGGGGRNASPIICVHDCPALREGLTAEDSLKNFRRAMAVQATPEQRAAFAKIAQYTQAASDKLQELRKSLPQATASAALSDRATNLDQALAQARAGNQNFLASFSDAQKSGLKELTGKLVKAESELDKQLKTFDQTVHSPKPETDPVVNSATALDKALASFQSEQLTLGKEMSVLFDPASQNVIFSLPTVTNSISIADQSISIPASGAISRTSVGASNENGHDLFSLKLVADLSDLQQNITAILRSELTRAPRCGERIEVRQATLTPLAPASLVVANLHFERWVCTPGQSPMEVAEGDATLEVTLTLSVGQNAGLNLASEITRVEADAFLRSSLRTGDLGVTLRDQIAASVLSALQKAGDFKTTLPPAAQSATLQKAVFQDDGADQMSLVLDGQLQFSDEQTQQFAAQLKQRLAAQGTTPQ